MLGFSEAMHYLHCWSRPGLIWYHNIGSH